MNMQIQSRLVISPTSFLASRHGNPSPKDKNATRSHGLYIAHKGGGEITRWECIIKHIFITYFDQCWREEEKGWYRMEVAQPVLSQQKN